MNYAFTKSLTFYIIAANVIVWILQMLTYPLIDDVFALDPQVTAGKAYQFVTYMFLHATYVETSGGGVTIYPLHIAVNMLVFVVFGFPLEQTIGRKKFIALYLASGVGSAAFFILVTSLFAGASGAGLIGASGAVFGVLAAYAFKYPKSWVYMFGFFPMPAALTVVFLLLEETFFGFMGIQPGVANFGHVGGIITGLAMMTAWKLTGKKEKSWDGKGFEYVWE
jgi:rhomboid-like protein